MNETEILIQEFKHLINEELPSTYTRPVCLNHCFNRIILDWLFSDCWYNHLDNNKTALRQLNNQQLSKAIFRMEDWLSNQQLLIDDNNASLAYRKKFNSTYNILRINKMQMWKTALFLLMRFRKFDGSIG